jgi:hypothetical protein
MFGAIYFGQTYFAGFPELPQEQSGGNCDGMFGTATFGSPYFGQHIQCVPTPPIPPTPPYPPVVRVPDQLGGIGHRRHKDWSLAEVEAHNARRAAIIQDLIHEEIDEEDIALTVLLWLNIR